MPRPNSRWCYLVTVACATVCRASIASAQTVTVYGNWPPDGFCVRQFAVKPGVYQGIDAACNDKTSGVDVPFGTSLEICENGPPDTRPHGKCRRFLPGRYYVGNDFNDIASGFRVDNEMLAYVNSGDLPTSWKIGVTLSGPTEGPLKPGMMIGSDGGGMNMDYDIPLPPSCAHPQLVQTTKANKASWSGEVKEGRLKLRLHVDFRSGVIGIPTGANNWVGVAIRCHA